MEAVAAAMGTQETPEGRARIRGQSHSHQLDNCLLRFGPVQATPGRPVVWGPAHQACYLCSLLFPTSLTLLGRQGGVAVGVGERMCLLAPLLWGKGPPPWEEDHHLLHVKSAGPSFGGQPAAGWPRPSGCLSKESLNDVGRLLLMG